MKRTTSFLLLAVMLLSSTYCYAQHTNHALRNKLIEMIKPFRAVVGIAVKHIEYADTLSIGTYTMFPMQSVYKFPLAMAILHEVDEGRFAYDQKIHISKDQLHSNTWSPLARLYPDGNIDLTITELLDYTVSQSDNNTCDVLFGLLGGPKHVEDYIHQLGYHHIAIRTTEAEMAANADSLQEENWCYAFEMTRLLDDFYQGRYLSRKSYTLLMKLMTESSNSVKRIKGKLPETVVVAHKTGTGIKVVNDAGIITLPDGNHLALSVFIKQANETFEAGEALIANISKIAYDFYAKPKTPVKRINTDSIDHVINNTNKVVPISGNMLIAQNGEIIFEKSYGYADAIERKPLTTATSFQLASISKQFTAYGIMLLQYKGLLDYDSAAYKYLPGFPYHNITIRHLLNHTSGLPDFWEDIRPNLDTLRSNTNKDVLDYLIKHQLPLQSEPGATFSYCDIGYDFLANIIENISGRSYDVFLDQHIFKPLGMTHTYAYKITDIKRLKNEQLAKGHVYKQHTFVYAHEEPGNNFVSYLGDLYGDGSVVSTARDLYKWEQALTNCTLLPCAFQQEAFKPALYKGNIVYVEENISYGFGWFVKTNVTNPLIYHTGFHPGNVHGYYRLRKQGITFIFLSNAETPNVRALRKRILQMLE